MEFKKLSAPTLKELFIKELESCILSGKLPIGSKLPPERELAVSMQISRSVVNAGIKKLAEKGFLDIRQRQGTFIADFRKEGTIDTFLSIMNYNGGILRKEEVKSILELRIALDSLAVELGSKDITDSEILQLRNLTESIGRAASPHEAAESAFAFHHHLALFSGNSLLPLIFRSFKALTYSLWLRFCALYGIPALYENTNELCTLIEERDFEGAESYLKRSLSDSISGHREIYYTP
ncbi:GntR family transcriptional regulator [Clostridium boliviensis]|uniref:GntR family transcriptional regulator n=1 Tax=Clostridium boliviensis TaxID=318465 RepID=A0ABU4GSH2_9CLOT|nr:GntR family transcriptional regulator [Clostridium boliviensis]MDW2800576.1 GntR family transcriptional regulator [Clostridium boliviensis]